MPEPRALLPTIVLIHGAWAGSWVWSKLIPLLERQGWPVVAPDLPGTAANPASADQYSLQGCVDHVIASCSASQGPLILVGHSGGGAVATQVAEALAERVAGVIYVAGMMLPSGLGFAQLVQELKQQDPMAAGISTYLEWSEDRQWTRVPPEAVCEIFLQDVPQEEARRLAGRFVPQPEGTRALVPQWTPERFGRIPRLYIEALQDRSVILALQRRMQALVPGAEVVSLDCGHVPQAAAVESLFAAMVPFIQRTTESHQAPALAG